MTEGGYAYLSWKKESAVKARKCRELVHRWFAEGRFDEMLPEIAALRGVRQSEEFHAEGDAFVHTMLAMEAVDDDEDPRVFWAALLHDIGKAEKTFFDGTRWRAVGHAEAGAEQVPAIMTRLGFADLAADVSWLVRHHLFHFSWNLDHDFRLTRNQRRLMEHPLFPLLLRVCQIDADASYGRSSKGDKIGMIAEVYAEEYGDNHEL